MSHEGTEKRAKCQSESEAEKSSESVHSANKWESADLGDTERREKFLRLMGAGKSDHKGKFIIGDSHRSHGRTENETAKVLGDIETQYQKSLDFKLTGKSRHHVGLGFQEEAKKDTAETKEGEKKEGEKKEGETKEGDKKESETKEGDKKESETKEGDKKEDEKTQVETKQGKDQDKKPEEKGDHKKEDEHKRKGESSDGDSVKAKYMKMSFVKSSS